MRVCSALPTYAQARMLHANKGNPAWRHASCVGMIVGTGLAEGAGLLCGDAVLVRTGVLRFSARPPCSPCASWHGGNISRPCAARGLPAGTLKALEHRRPLRLARPCGACRPRRCGGSAVSACGASGAFWRWPRAAGSSIRWCAAQPLYAGVRPAADAVPRAAARQDRAWLGRAGMRVGMTERTTADDTEKPHGPAEEWRCTKSVYMDAVGRASMAARHARRRIGRGRQIRGR